MEKVREEVVNEYHFWRLNSEEAGQYIGTRGNCLRVYVDVVRRNVYLVYQSDKSKYAVGGFTPLLSCDGTPERYTGDIWEISTLKSEVEMRLERALK